MMAEPFSFSPVVDKALVGEDGEASYAAVASSSSVVWVGTALGRRQRMASVETAYGAHTCYLGVEGVSQSCRKPTYKAYIIL